MTAVRLAYFSVRGKLAFLFWAVGAASAALAVAIARWLDNGLLAAVGVALVAIPAALWLAILVARPLRRLVRALLGLVASYREGDFSLSLANDRQDELGELLSAHNALGDALRAERANLVQRERLLDTLMQESPAATVLVDANGRVAYANLAARGLFGAGRSLTGRAFEDVLRSSPPALQAHAAGPGDSLFTAEIDDSEETFHLSQRSFVLQGRSYRLLLVKRLTRELSRQEVATWKKLIRVLSHELNNTLGPLSSLAHTGAEMSRRGDRDALPDVFAAIGERARHLHEFVSGYAEFARLPAPRPENVEWEPFLADLARQASFRAGTPPSRPGYFDRVQVEQVLINLLKNAHESGGAPAEVEIAIVSDERQQRFEVRDRGSGMSAAVLAQALLPFYSTKRSGTGIGLALAREIAEAHGGRIHLANRDGGGLCVTMTLPARAAAGR